jgi:hypothetical protein
VSDPNDRKRRESPLTGNPPEVLMGIASSPEPSASARPPAGAPAVAEPTASEVVNQSDRAEPAAGVVGKSHAVPPDPTPLIASLIVVASLMSVIWNLQDASLDNANTGSRYATIESLVDYGTYSIDKSRYVRTIDKRKANGHFISSKPPTLPTYAAGVYWVYQKFTGKTIADHEGDVVRFVSLFTGGIFHLVFLIFFYRLCRMLIKKQLALIAVTAAAGFCYLGVAYATAINNHSIAAAIGVAGLFYAYRIRQNLDAGVRSWIYCGLCFGFMAAVDLPCGIFVPIVGLYLGTHNWRRTLLCFLPAVLPGAFCQLLLGYISSGSIIPAYVNSELKEFEGSYFNGRQRGIDALREPKHIYAFHALLGHHGLFSMTPVLGFGLWELVRSLRRRERLAEGLLVGSALLTIVGFYIFRTRNYGGWCVGMRWFVPVMPLLLLYFGLWLDRIRITRLTWSAVLIAFAVGAFNVQDGLTSPFQFSRWHNFLEGHPNHNRVGTKMNLGRAHKKASREKKLRKKKKRGNAKIKRKKPNRK